MISRKTLSVPVSFVAFLTFLICVEFYCGEALAGYASQAIELRPGWNAVFLEVDPPDRSPEVVFNGLPVESVWRWNPSETFVQFIDDPDDLVPDDPDWLVWFHPDYEYSEHLTNLFAVFGETPYLVKLAGTSNVTFNVTGEPKLPRIRWKPQSMNLVGFHLKPGSEPSFSDFFSPSDALGNASPTVYGLNAEGDWERLTATDAMKSGEAYWVKCDEATDYTGPIGISTPSLGGLDFGKTTVEQGLSIQNLTNGEVDIKVTPTNSSPDGPAVDGTIPLSRWVRPPAQDTGWNDFDGPVDLVYAAKEDLDLRLAIRRTALTEPGVYRSLLEIDDNAGMRILVPVVTGSGTARSPVRSARAPEPEDGPPERTGLWVGFATVDNVNQPAVADDPGTPDVNEQEEPTPTDSEFNFRLIVHVDDDGNVKLLREVLQLWKPPVTDAEGNVTEDGRFALFTDASLVEGTDYLGDGVRDGRPTGRRISSAVFSFDNPLTCAEGSAFELDQEIAASYQIGYNDPLNPYKHKYHPDHDNLNKDFETEKMEAFDITRSITLAFTESDPTNLNKSQPGWGDTSMGGTYREKIEGLHKDGLFVEGHFRLIKISDLGVLNDGLH